MGKVLTEVRIPQRKLAPDTVGLEERKPTSLWEIANKARADKRYRFQDLYRCLDEEFLLRGWYSLNWNAAAGVDKVTVEEYSNNLTENIQGLVKRLKQKKYRAKLVRRHYIPKENGKRRPLGIPALEDKIVQAACAMLLSAIYEQDFLDCSYGYRPERGAGDAVKELTFELQFGCYGYLVEADIRSFFDKIDHDWLLKMLSQRIDDKAFLKLIRKWLKAGILDTDGKVIYPDTGSPQGGLVSPVLANIYLHYALDLWVEKVVKPSCLGEVMLCRYADDFVCAFRFKDEAERFYNALPERLEKFGLEVAEEKTQILRFSRFRPSMERRFIFLGFEFYWWPDRKGVPRVTRRTARKKLQAKCKAIKDWIKLNKHLPGWAFIKKLNARLRGHYNYYGVRGNSRSVHRFSNWAMRNAFKWLNRRGGKRKSFTWAKFSRVINRYIAKPRITEVERREVYA